MSWCVLNTIPWVRLRSTTTRQNFGSNPATTTIPLSENPDISKKKTGTTTCIQRDFPWIKIPELSWSRRIAKKTDGIHHSYRIIKEGGSPTGGFLSLPYSFVSFRKVPYAYNISARNRHPHVTIHKPSLLHAYICVSMEPNSHITRLIAIFRSQETRKEEARHQTHESSTRKTCRWQWCNLPRNSLVKNANYRCVIRSSWLPPLPVMGFFWNRIHSRTKTCQQRRTVGGSYFIYKSAQVMNPQNYL